MRRVMRGNAPQMENHPNIPREDVGRPAPCFECVSLLVCVCLCVHCCEQRVRTRTRASVQLVSVHARVRAFVPRYIRRARSRESPKIQRSLKDLLAEFKFKSTLICCAENRARSPLPFVESC